MGGVSTMLLVLAVLVLAGLPCLGSRGECLSECFQRKDDFGECQKTELVHISSQLSSSSPDVAIVTFYHDQARPPLDEFYQALLVLICEDQAPSWQYNQAPYCVLNATSFSAVPTATECSQCSSNCSVESIIVWNWRTNTTVPASLVVRILNTRPSKLVLHSLGVPFLSAAVNKEASIFDEVPIGSWVCVLVGIVAFSIILSQPLWWTSGLKRLKRTSHNS